ncbi:MAG: ketol-acid reductoisomerase [Candidatus Bathyarchaeota archaeon]|nr:MAG: ketol-acid reductoisomerase [Candidatus Bathyarchaeota archaeon]
MVKIYYDSDADLSVLSGKTVAIVGYGIQGSAQAKNLRDSGVKVILGLRPEGKSWKLAKDAGFDVFPISEATKAGDLIIMLIPDMAQPEVYQTHIKENLTEGKALGFSHGFNIHFKTIVPPKNVDVIMIAPKSPGKRLRQMYVDGSGVPALLAVEQDYTRNAKDIALAWAKGIGSTVAGVLETSFKEETESDLIGEQTVLVGGLIELIKTGFEVLVEEGYQPELAYFEACNEAKLIMDLIFTSGITGMLKGVSTTANYGGVSVGPKVIDKQVKERMKQAAKRVKSGEFAEEWIAESKSGGKKLKQLLKENEEHQIEKVGKIIRKMAGIEA